VSVGFFLWDSEGIFDIHWAKTNFGVLLDILTPIPTPVLFQPTHRGRGRLTSSSSLSTSDIEVLVSNHRAGTGTTNMGDLMHITDILFGHYVKIIGNDLDNFTLACSNGLK